MKLAKRKRIKRPDIARRGSRPRWLTRIKLAKLRGIAERTDIRAALVGFAAIALHEATRMRNRYRALRWSA